MRSKHQPMLLIPHVFPKVADEEEKSAPRGGPARTSPLGLQKLKTQSVMTIPISGIPFCQPRPFRGGSLGGAFQKTQKMTIYSDWCRSSWRRPSMAGSLKRIPREKLETAGKWKKWTFLFLYCPSAKFRPSPGGSSRRLFREKPWE